MKIAPTKVSRQLTRLKAGYFRAIQYLPEQS
jgi:hypothetical protein